MEKYKKELLSCEEKMEINLWKMAQQSSQLQSLSNRGLDET